MKPATSKTETPPGKKKEEKKAPQTPQKIEARDPRPEPSQQVIVGNRYTIAWFFDIKNGNPNGDPGAGGIPRTYALTGHGFVTDVCLKRKLRNYVNAQREGAPGFNIFVEEGTILNRIIEEAHVANGVDLNAPTASGDKRMKAGSAQGEEIPLAQNYLCRHFWDIRAFGAVASTGANAGQITGPVTVTFAESMAPLEYADVTITRCAVASEAESVDHNGANQTMGKKYAVPYALYRASVYVSPLRAAKTGMGEDDLGLLLNGLRELWDFDRSASRGEMSTVRLVVFRHEYRLGNAHDSDLQARVQARALVPVPRKASDYEIIVDQDNLPPGVTVTVF